MNETDGAARPVGERDDRVREGAEGEHADDEGVHHCLEGSVLPPAERRSKISLQSFAVTSVI